MGGLVLGDPHAHRYVTRTKPPYVDHMVGSRKVGATEAGSEEARAAVAKSEKGDGGGGQRDNDDGDIGRAAREHERPNVGSNAASAASTDGKTPAHVSVLAQQPPPCTNV